MEQFRDLVKHVEANYDLKEMQPAIMAFKTDGGSYITIELNRYGFLTVKVLGGVRYISTQTEDVIKYLKSGDWKAVKRQSRK